MISTPASAGVVAIEGTGNEIFYSTQFIGYNLFNAKRPHVFKFDMMILKHLLVVALLKVRALN